MGYYWLKQKWRVGRVGRRRHRGRDCLAENSVGKFRSGPEAELTLNTGIKRREQKNEVITREVAWKSHQNKKIRPGGGWTESAALMWRGIHGEEEWNWSLRRRMIDFQSISYDTQTKESVGGIEYFQKTISVLKAEDDQSYLAHLENQEYFQLSLNKC